MKPFNQLNIGSVHVHKTVLADIVATAVESIDGVHMVPKTITDTIVEFFGRQKVPGVEIEIDQNSDVSIEVKIIIRYGMNIPDVARQIQNMVRSSIDQTVDINLKDINVNIQGIERGSA